MIAATALATASLGATAVEPAGLAWSQLPPLPDRLGLGGAFAGVCGGDLLVAGGSNFPDKMPWAGGKKAWHDAVYALGRTNAAWRVVGKLPRPLGYGVSLTTSEGLLCVGGSDADRHYADVFRLVQSRGKLRIQTLPFLPVPLAYAAGALVGRVAYVAGGADRPGEQAALNRFLALDLDHPAAGWRDLEPCPGEARILAVATGTGDAFYLAGGAALRPVDGKVKRAYLRDAWRFTAAGKWERLADLPKPCVAAPTPGPIVDSTLLLVGGDDGSLAGFQPPEKHPGFARTILGLDLRTGKWTKWGRTPAPRATLVAVEWDGLFVLPSGELRPGVRSAEVWTFRVDQRP